MKLNCNSSVAVVGNVASQNILRNDSACCKRSAVAVPCVCVELRISVCTWNKTVKTRAVKTVYDTRNKVVDGISVLSWSQGTTADNCKVNYKGGVATVKINAATKEIVEADYTMKAYVNVTHANIAVIKDKSASLDITMQWKYPASAEYLQSSKGITLVG